MAKRNEKIIEMLQAHGGKIWMSELLEIYGDITPLLHELEEQNLITVTLKLGLIGATETDEKIMNVLRQRDCEMWLKDLFTICHPGSLMLDEFEKNGEITICLKLSPLDAHVRLNEVANMRIVP